MGGDSGACAGLPSSVGLAAYDTCVSLGASVGIPFAVANSLIS